jgi:hypothetical protein
VVRLMNETTAVAAAYSLLRTPPKVLVDTEQTRSERKFLLPLYVMILLCLCALNE